MDNNIDPTYCSFEIAKLLKEKGFNTTLLTSYCAYNGLEANVPGGEFNNSGTKYVLKPQHHQITKWLRVNHSISISIITGNNAKGFVYFGQIAFVDKKGIFRIHTLKMNDYEKIENMTLAWNKIFESYEQAENEAILYCLEKII